MSENIMVKHPITGVEETYSGIIKFSDEQPPNDWNYDCVVVFNDNEESRSDGGTVHAFCSESKIAYGWRRYIPNTVKKTNYPQQMKKRTNTEANNNETLDIRVIIGDPLNKLTQDEVTDRIQKLANVLLETTGIMDALQMIDTLPGMSTNERKVVATCRAQIREMLDKVMPEWDDVCNSIRDANR